MLDLFDMLFASFFQPKTSGLTSLQANSAQRITGTTERLATLAGIRLSMRSLLLLFIRIYQIYLPPYKGFRCAHCARTGRFESHKSCGTG